MWELILILLLVVILLFAVRRRRPLPIGTNAKVLLVIAHPDDETMFFAPTLRALTSAGHRVFVLCLSSGDFYGLGKQRIPEIREACHHLGVNRGDVTVLDYHDLRDGSAWEARRLGEVVMRHTETLSVDTILTFDTRGVSGHPNHSSCFHGVQHAYTHSLVPEHVQIFVLDSIPLWRKYIGLWDSIFSYNQSPFSYVARLRDVYACWCAMRAHRTQLVWFRRLYIVFSRYVYINNLRRIAPIDLIATKFSHMKAE